MGSVSPSEKHGSLEVMSDDDGYSSEATVTQQLLSKERGFGMRNSEDLESQKPLKEQASGKHGAEYSVPPVTKYSYLGLYFGLNLGLTLFNKAVLGKVWSKQYCRGSSHSHMDSSLFHGSSPSSTPASPHWVVHFYIGGAISK